MAAPPPNFHYCLGCSRILEDADYCSNCYARLEFEQQPRQERENPELAAFLDDYAIPHYLSQNRSLNVLFCGRVRAWKTTLAIRLAEMLQKRNNYGIFYSLRIEKMLEPHAEHHGNAQQRGQCGVHKITLQL